jgi:U3 small nucleolar ribonucleoprotein protein LCP5
VHTLNGTRKNQLFYISSMPQLLEDAENTHEIHQLAVEADALFEAIPDTLEGVKEKLKMLKHRHNEGQMEMNKGISLLDVKLHNMMSYITRLLIFVLAKIDGIKATPSLGDLSLAPDQVDDSFNEIVNLDQLIQTRIILEKIRPLEAKLKYQMDKMLRSNIVKQQTDMADPLSFRPNPANLDVVEQEEEVITTAQEGIYKPPKIAPKYYAEGKTHLTGNERKKLGKSRILADIREEITDAPMEESTSGIGYSSKDASLRGQKGRQTQIDRELAEREAFEEDNFIRLTQGKKERRLQRDAAGSAGLLHRMREDFDVRLNVFVAN